MNSIFASRLIKALLALMIFSLASSAASIERRRPQINKDSGYVVAPVPYRLEGIGQGIGLLGALNNVGGTTVDLLATYITGDVAGGVGLVTGVPIFTDHINFDYVRTDFNKGALRTYQERGMEGEGDYTINELKSVSLDGYRVTLNFYEKRLNFSYVHYNYGFQAGNIKSKDGEIIAESSGTKNTAQIRRGGLKLDYTDDRQDPRKGIRLEYIREKNERFSEDSPEFHVNNFYLTGYVPLLEKSTFAFHYMQSDAVVTDEGLTDEQTLRAKQTYTCAGKTGTELEACEEGVNIVINNQISQNKYGNASSLGGNNRLRSFSEGRFSGAHSRFWGAEFRWNLSDESKEYDLIFTHDFRTLIQWAFFYETGSVADVESELYKKTKFSAGTGLRMVTKSGFIYRADIATGNEGPGFILWFEYPWVSIN